MALSPGNVDCTVQMAMWLSPEVSPPPQVTIVHSRSNQCINLSLFYCTNMKTGKWSPA